MAKPYKRRSYHKLHKYIRANEGDKVQISLVGVGGTGSHILANLAAINSVQEKMDGRLLHVKAYDFDDVERHNVGKQLYFKPDEGKNKAVQAVGRINRAYGFDWEGYPKKYNGSPSNIVITAVDSWKARTAIFNSIVKTKENYNDRDKVLYWLDVGNGQNDGQVILWAYRDTKMMSVVERAAGGEISTHQERNSCSMVQSLATQGMFINKFMATIATEMLYKLIYNQTINHNGIVVNLESMRMLPLML